MRISDWSSDVCSSDLRYARRITTNNGRNVQMRNALPFVSLAALLAATPALAQQSNLEKLGQFKTTGVTEFKVVEQGGANAEAIRKHLSRIRSEEHTSELQSLMRLSYAVFCLKKKTKLDKTA